MKIVIIIADIKKTGGTERATCTLSNFLCDEHQITIFSLGKEGNPFFLLDNRVKLSFMGLEVIPTNLYEKILWYYQMWKILKLKLKDFSPDIIIGEGHNISSIIPFVKNKNSRTIACEHIDYESIPKWSQNLMKLSYQKLNYLIVLSKIAKDKMENLSNQIVVIPNSLPFSTDEIAEQNNDKIIMVGRISKEKGYERLIPIAKKLQVEFPKWTIEIYGDGPLKNIIQELFRSENITNIVINDPVENIKNKYLNSSIHLITSYNEAMPMVILEAQYCGLPVIGFRCEGTEALIQDGLNGFIVDSEQEFYTNLKSLILNRKERITLGLNARKSAEIYDTQNIKKQWENVLRTVS